MRAVGASIVDDGEGLIQERSLLKYPVYQAWQRGELSLGALWSYAGQRCLDALWSILDSVSYAAVGAGAAE